MGDGGGFTTHRCHVPRTVASSFVTPPDSGRVIVCHAFWARVAASVRRIEFRGEKARRTSTVSADYGSNGRPVSARTARPTVEREFARYGVARVGSTSPLDRAMWLRPGTPHEGEVRREVVDAPRVVISCLSCSPPRPLLCRDRFAPRRDRFAPSPVARVRRYRAVGGRSA